MKRAKKDRPKAGTFEQSRPGLAPRTHCKIIISNSRQNASPNLDGGGGALPMSWELMLTIIGAGWLTGQGGSCPLAWTHQIPQRGLPSTMRRWRNAPDAYGCRPL